jgi:hypothetical protein
MFNGTGDGATVGSKNPRSPALGGLCLPGCTSCTRVGVPSSCEVEAQRCHILRVLSGIEGFATTDPNEPRYLLETSTLPRYVYKHEKPEVEQGSIPVSREPHPPEPHLVYAAMCSSPGSAFFAISSAIAAWLRSAVCTVHQ